MAFKWLFKRFNKIVNPEEDIKLILSGVRALQGNITSPLRSVSVEFKDKKIFWKCVFDSNATEADYELLSMAAGEVIADFPGYSLEENIITIPFPEKQDPLKNLLFQRNENNYYRN